jgi:hypothetical protein
MNYVIFGAAILCAVIAPGLMWSPYRPYNWVGLFTPPFAFALNAEVYETLPSIHGVNIAWSCAVVFFISAWLVLSGKISPITPSN